MTEGKKSNTIDLRDGVSKFFETEKKDTGMSDNGQGMNPPESKSDDFDSRYRRMESDIDRDLILLKFRMFFNKLMHFPALAWNFVKNSLLGLLMRWLIFFGVGIALFLHFTDTYASLYYKMAIGVERAKNERMLDSLSAKQNQLRISDQKITCYKNQFRRISDERQVDINFCKEIK